jgi:predicted DNA binding CopG/RHH family protein
MKAAGTAPPEALDLINQYTRTPLTGSQVYTMKLTLCDNEIDRQYDQFTPEALNQLAALFIGKTVIFDHACSAKGQTARIYSTAVETIPGKTTSNGLPYMRLVAMAYMLNLPATAELITLIDGGILKEGSVGFSNSIDTCSICGNGYYSGDCPHIRGQTYTENGVSKTCFVILDGITDAYEFSFVAVPAQPAAGVTKGLKDGRTLSQETVRKLSAARTLRKHAEDCEKQARAIEDELVGGWPEDEPPQDETTPATLEEPKDVKAFKAQLKLIIGGF